MEIQYIGQIHNTLTIFIFKLFDCITYHEKKSTPIRISFQIMKGRTFTSQYNYRVQPC
jgi:hypothetical protein